MTARQRRPRYRARCETIIVTTTTKIARRTQACPKPRCRGKWRGNPGCRASTYVDPKPSKSTSRSTFPVPDPLNRRPRRITSETDPLGQQSTKVHTRGTRCSAPPLTLSLSLSLPFHLTMTFNERDSRFDESIIRCDRRSTITAFRILR